MTIETNEELLAKVKDAKVLLSKDADSAVVLLSKAADEAKALLSKAAEAIETDEPAKVLLNEAANAAEVLLSKATMTAEVLLVRVKRLEGIIPICSYCKKIRDDEGCWNQLEAYLHSHSDAEFSHGACPECFNKEMEKMDKG